MANLRVAELDFDQIKTNLKQFLQAQTEFTDYDFEGSGLSTLIDVLAYNTHYNAYLANMLVNEMFLDSSVKRSSAVSLAKHLGYTPRSTRSAKALLNVVINNPTGTPTSVAINRFTPFNVTLNSVPYTFYNLKAEDVVPSNGVYQINDLEVVEGTPLEISYVVTNPGPDEKFEIPSAVVDTTTLLVTVQTSATDTTSQSYTLSEDITSLDGTSTVYFLEENPFERYQIFFGDGVLGKKLTVGNIITIRYLASSGPNANSSNITSQSFTTTTIGGSTDVTVLTATNPRGGAEKESIASIKFNAPRTNSAKNRAVTASDYQTLITASFSEAESVTVWGGEDNNPPAYGKVFISLKPNDGFFISQSTKDNVLNSILKNKKVLAIIPEIIDPEYYFVNLVVDVVYDSGVTTKTASQVKDTVTATIINYFKSDLQQFNKTFNKSRLNKLILDSDTSVQSVLLKIKLQQRFPIFLNVNNSFESDRSIQLQNSVIPGSVTSSRFFEIQNNVQVLSKFVDIPDTSPADDLGTGTLQILNATDNSVLNSKAGTVNYGTGQIIINNFIPTSLPNAINDFRFTAAIQESSQNLKVYRNQILVLDDSTLNPLAGREAGVTITVTAA
jgi:hypothetical protein